LEDKLHLAVLIPAFNEEATIQKVIRSIPEKLLGIEKISIIVVNDGSTDNTEKLAKEAGAIVVTHKTNKRLGPTFRDGLEKAMELKADILVTIDADGQFDTNEIPKLIKPIIDNEADFVTGSRFEDHSTPPENMPWIKRWGNHRVASIISWATGKKFKDVTCGFRAYSKEAMLRLNLFGKFTYTQETFLDLAYKDLSIKEIPVTVKYFKDRKSKIASSLVNYGLNSANIIFRAIKDYKPLKFFGLTGIIIFLLGLGFDIFLLIHYSVNLTFSPFKSLGFLGAFLNAIGVLVFFIGILADLIDKIRQTQEKFLYLQKKDYYYDGK
jgi:glycosyltransferase involved in cell wall biosynthesis